MEGDIPGCGYPGRGFDWVLGG